MSVKLNNVELNFEKREVFGKYAAKCLRNKEKKILAIAYNKGQPAMHFVVDFVEFTRLASKIKSEKIVLLKNGTETFTAVINDIQRDPVSDLPIHIDFQILEEGQRIKYMVPVEVINQNMCLAIKSGGFLNLVKRRIEVSCSVEDLPKTLQIDVKNATIGTSIRISDFIFPENVECDLDPYMTVITIAGKKAAKAKEAELGAAADSTAVKSKEKSDSSDKAKKEEKKPKTAAKK